MRRKARNLVKEKVSAGQASRMSLGSSRLLTPAHGRDRHENGDGGKARAASAAAVIKLDLSMPLGNLHFQLIR